MNTRLVERTLAFVGLLSVLFFPVPGVVLAQQQRLNVAVVYIAGSDVYLSVGTDDGLRDGDTLTVIDSTGNTLLGMLIVRSTSSGRSVVGFAGPSFPITRGDHLDIQLPARVVETAEPGPPLPGDRTSRGSRTSLRTSGRISFDVNALHTQRKGSQVGAAPISRDFTTPTVRFRSRTTGLPAGFTANFNGRVSRRYSTGDILPVQSTRIYQASLGATLTEFPIQLELGRFYNRYASHSGFWDGLVARYGTENAGAGFAVGFEPSRSDEAFSSDQPKLAGFVNVRARRGALRYSSDFSFNHIMPTNPGIRDRTFLGLTQDVRLSRFRANQDIQIDRDRVGGRWVVTRLRLRASLELGRRIRLHWQYSLRQPYALLNSTGAASFRRDIGSAGLAFTGRGGYVGTVVTVTKRRGGTTGYAYSSSFNVDRLPILGVGLFGSVVYRTQGSFKTLLAGPGFTRSFGRLKWRVSYQLYRSKSNFTTLLSHSTEASLTFPVGRNLTATVRMRSQFGENLSSTNGYASIRMTF